MIRNAIASLPVKNLSNATDWYTRLFGRKPDSTPMKELAEWKFDGGGWLQVYQAPERAGGGSCTLSVEDLRGEVERLQKLGFSTPEPMQVSIGTIMMISDPDGNTVALAQPTDPTIAQ
jgi:predicted enzyme related to lactoylglutathione lyase